MTDWDATLRTWIKPPSNAEETRRDNTEALIRAALDDYTPLPNATIRVFAQGSYKNKTNVRLLSDVDIAVEYQEGESTPTSTPRVATTDQRGSAKDLTNADLGLSDHGKFTTLPSDRIGCNLQRSRSSLLEMVTPGPDNGLYPRHGPAQGSPAKPSSRPDRDGKRRLDHRRCGERRWISPVLIEAAPGGIAPGGRTGSPPAVGMEQRPPSGRFLFRSPQ